MSSRDLICCPGPGTPSQVVRDAEPSLPISKSAYGLHTSF